MVGVCGGGKVLAFSTNMPAYIDYHVKTVPGWPSSSADVCELELCVVNLFPTIFIYNRDMSPARLKNVITL